MHLWMAICRILVYGHTVSGAYLLFEVGIPNLVYGCIFQIWCMDAPLDGDMSCTIFESL